MEHVEDIILLNIFTLSCIRDHALIKFAVRNQLN